MTAITIPELTSVALKGSGVFDQLMQSVELRLQQEYNKGRIKGADYSKVYLGAMDSVMQQSLAFVMGKQTADKQADLLSAQAANELLQADLITEQVTKMQSEIALIDQKLTNSIIEGANLTKIGLKLESDKALVDSQILKIDQENLLVIQQKLKITQDIAIGVVQEANIVQDTAVKLSQVSKLTQDISMSQTQQVNLAAEKLKIDAQTSGIVQDEANAVLQGDVLTNQVLKVAAETSFLAQKKLTEEAQIVDRVTGAAADVGGVVGNQRDLYVAQKDGFKRDAEQKAAKITTDAWIVRKANDTTGIATPAHFTQAGVDSVFDVLFEGVDADPVTLP